ncbi:MAG: alginate export family protein [Deltaproteobacteria bacterium]|nr:alginate export family protein [Deltaproteobacteria bacterium]MBZ0219788.1 alginate export family protein [Deltaproteobacteria bacterium]
MKRILLSVFAAAVTVAWTAPASADVTFNGEYRARGEYRNNQDFNDTDTVADDDNRAFIGQRIRLTANAQASDDVSVKITLQDTRLFGADGTNGLLTDTQQTNQQVDIHEAYLNVTNIFDTPVNFRIGRQELNYGDQRLIGSFGWSNNARAFEGLKFNYVQDGINVDLFRMTLTETTSATAGSNDDTTLTGVYATLGQLIPNNTLDVYLLNVHTGVGGGTIGDERYTIGARLAGSAAGLDYTVEFPYQFGEVSNTVDIKAWALAAKVGYTIPGAPMNLRIGAEYDYATGDDNPNDNDNETFNQLFPTNHGHFGIGDVVNTWSDIQAWSLNASADISEKLRVYVAYWNYTENEATGVDHGSTTGAGADDELGSEIDLVATYKYNNNLTIEAGAARFMPGDGITPAGTSDDDQDWAYLQITAKF